MERGQQDSGDGRDSRGHRSAPGCARLQPRCAGGFTQNIPAGASPAWVGTEAGWELAHTPGLGCRMLLGAPGPAAASGWARDVAMVARWERWRCAGLGRARLCRVMQCVVERNGETRALFPALLWLFLAALGELRLPVQPGVWEDAWKSAARAVQMFSGWAGQAAIGLRGEPGSSRSEGAAPLLSNRSGFRLWYFLFVKPKLAVNLA